MRQFVRRCLLLLVLVAGAARGFRQRRPAEIRRVLLIRPDHLGDLLFTTPALAELRRALPDAHITYLIGPWFREIAARNPNVDEIQTCAFPGFRRERQSALEPYRLLWRLASELRGQRYDLAIVLRPDFWWGVWLSYLAGIPLCLGYADELQTRFLTVPLPVREGEHAVRQNLRLARAAALLAKAIAGNERQVGKLSSEQVTLLEQVAPVDGQPPLAFAPTDEERAWVRERLARADIAERDRLIVLHPGTGAPVKLWEAGSWARVADALADAYSVRIVLTGSEGERAEVERIRAQMQQPALALIGETDLGKLAALLERADLALGVDNGPLHLATAQGTPTARLYGPTDPRIFAPWGDPALHRIIQARRVCPGCAAIPCGRLDWPPEALPDHPCVRSIASEEVLMAAEALL
ncbi:MAG TPA: glycosyltransferase family 9 protein, partial [Ktedonobacterales bacterium]